jgi:hypothetical protein
MKIDKLKPKTRYRIIFTAYIGVQIVAFLTAPLFPIYFNLRFLKKWNPFWILLDDYRLNEDGTPAEDYRIYLRDYKWKPWGIFCWHIFRNRAWNFIELFPVDNGDPKVGLQNIAITNMVEDNLTDFNGRKLKSDGAYPIGAGLKYVGKPGDSPWQVNRGDEISITHSVIGRSEFDYITPSGWRGWRKTSCELKRVWWLLGAKRWVTKFRGMNANRYSFKQKYQKDKPKREWTP